jgi:predicted transcriptional regulator
VPCINADGTLTESAVALLKFLEQPHTPEEVSAAMGRPLYWVRMSLREMVGADLVVADAGGYQASEKGRARVRAA